jgi:hypothetical protein
MQSVLRLQLIENEGHHSLICQGFNLFLRRNMKKDNSPYFRYVSERDAAGSDKLTGDILLQTQFVSLIFDYLVSAARGFIKNPTGHGMGLLDDLTTNYPFSRQLGMLDSQFKVYRLPLYLASYRNELINLFTAESLFGWLKENQNKRAMAAAGSSALLCQRDIVVKGTLSNLVLSCSPNGSLDLTVICRTNGKNLNDFTFRPQQNVATTIASSIAIESAGIIYEELVTAATGLHRDSLWSRATQTNRSNKPSDEELLKLIALCHLAPILQFADSAGLELPFAALNDDCLQCCESMLEDPAFWPSYKLVQQDDGPDQHIFYFSSEDLFLLSRAETSGAGKKVYFYILSLAGTELSDLSPSLVIQRFTNYLLHMTWKAFLAG